MYKVLIDGRDKPTLFKAGNLRHCESFRKQHVVLHSMSDEAQNGREGKCGDYQAASKKVRLVRLPALDRFVGSKAPGRKAALPRPPPFLHDGGGYRRTL